jgi:hypothetical protein
MAGIAEASARGAGEAGLAAGAQDQGDEQPRLKVSNFNRFLIYLQNNKILLCVTCEKYPVFSNMRQSLHKVLPNMSWAKSNM